jgi:hypothetical protein
VGGTALRIYLPHGLFWNQKTAPWLAASKYAYIKPKTHERTSTYSRMTPRIKGHTIQQASEQASKQAIPTPVLAEFSNLLGYPGNPAAKQDRPGLVTLSAPVMWVM